MNCDPEEELNPSMDQELEGGYLWTAKRKNTTMRGSGP
jgi:hypothetical protein